MMKADLKYLIELCGLTRGHRFKNYRENFGITNSYDVYSDEYKKSFVNKRFEELDFYTNTGLSCKHNEIIPIIKLYDSLGSGYDWKFLRRIQATIKVSDGNVSINVRKNAGWFMFRATIFLMLLCATFVYSVSYFSFNVINGITHLIMLMYFIFIVGLNMHFYFRHMDAKRFKKYIFLLIF